MKRAKTDDVALRGARDLAMRKLGSVLDVKIPEPSGVKIKFQRTKSKYRNIPVVVDGHRFDSKAEARRWKELDFMQRGKAITDLRRQVRYPLRVEGTVIGHIVPDFEYVDAKSGDVVTEDVKGKILEFFKWKAKHFEAQYGRKIVIVR